MARAGLGVVGCIKTSDRSGAQKEITYGSEGRIPMNENAGLLTSGLARVMHNKRYLIWFFLLNLLLAGFGTTGLRESSHAILDHSLYAERLTHGFDLGAFIELLARPEFGPMNSLMFPDVYFVVVFFLATALFLPGVFMGYSSTYRLPREDFFRACGRNLWRFIRLMIIAFIVMGILTGVLVGINSALGKAAQQSTNEKLPFELSMIGWLVIFLVMTIVRIWFDLAEVDVVLDDQRAVRKSIGRAFLHTFRGFFRLLGSYLVSAIVAAIILVGGLFVWNRFIAPESVFSAFVVSEITLFLLLIPRFWQRGIAVSYWQLKMLAPLAVITTTVPAVTPSPAPIAEILPAQASGEIS